MFPCKRCACCCKNVGSTPWGKEFSLPSGICRYLDTTSNLCTIYQQRPIFCNVDAYYEKYLSTIMTREEFYQLNQQQCEKLYQATYVPKKKK